MKCFVYLWAGKDGTKYPLKRQLERQGVNLQK